MVMELITKVMGKAKSGLPKVEDPALTKLKTAAQKRQEQEEKNRAQMEKAFAQQLGVAGEAVETAERLGVLGQAMATEQGALARQQVRGGPRGATSGAGAASAAIVAAKTAAAQRDAAERARVAKLQAKEKQAQAQEDVALKRQQLLKTEAADEVATAQAVQDAKDLFQQAIDDTIIFFSMDDRRAVAEDIKAGLAGASPATIAAVEKYINDVVLNPDHDASWRIG